MAGAGPVRRALTGRLVRRLSAGGHRGLFSRRARACSTQGPLAVPRRVSGGRDAVQGAGIRPSPMFLVQLDDRPRFSKYWKMSRVFWFAWLGVGGRRVRPGLWMTKGVYFEECESDVPVRYL